MKKIVFIIFGILFYSCCKEEIPTSNPLIGQWNIFRVDSGYSPSIPKEWFHFIRQLEYTGSFEFKNDSTGYLTGSIINITDNESKFIWAYDTTYLPSIWIPFAFLSGESLAMIDTINSDTLVLYFPDFIFQPNVLGINYYYHIQLVKKSSIK
ncbi:MAG: hypothetical protein D4R64_05775 [Porphyromonadaceae bacterium]|nr:MAG: hypothetical protein D4R64_05775 [Porphyromonadaceae bacterium]